MTFGEFMKQKREQINPSLRKFSTENGYHASYISKLESGGIRPPQDQKKLETLARALKIDKGSPDFLQLADLAFVENKTFSFEKISDEEMLKGLPQLFRVIGEKQMSQEKIDKIIETILEL